MLVPNSIRQPTTGIFHSLVKTRLEGDLLALETGALEEWHPHTQELTRWIKDEGLRIYHAARWRHTAVSGIRGLVSMC
jgi:hypothetical protein